MKKTCLLLAAMLALPTVATVQPAQEVSAYTLEGGWSDVYSTRAGAYSGLDRAGVIEVDSDEDFEGWKAAICPADNWTLDGAVLTASPDSKDWYVSDIIETDEGKYVCEFEIRWGTLESDIPEGDYELALFDENGVARVDYREDWVSIFVKDKFPVCFEAEMGFGEEYDGFVYAYVYEVKSDKTGMYSSLSADTYPIFLAEDGKTAITRFSAYESSQTSKGVKHVYQLEVLDKSKFEKDEFDLIGSFYRINGNLFTPGRVSPKGRGIICDVEDMKGEPPISLASTKTYLQSAMKKAQSINTKGKTKASVKALAEALEAAEAVLANENSTRKEIADALKAVNAAMEGLKDETTAPSSGTTDKKQTETSNKNKKTSPKTGEGFWDFLF